MDKKEASIKLLSHQYDGELSEETEIFTIGSYEKTAEGYKISYEESEATGYEGSFTTLEIIGERMVIMDRTGNTEANLIVDSSSKHHCIFGTPYGQFTVGVDSREIRAKFDENGGNLFVHYVLDVNSSYAGDFEITVEVKTR